MPEKYIFRTKAEKEYTVIRNSLIADKSLSWEARGLLIYLLSKPETWIVMKRDLLETSPAGEKKTTSTLKELERSGYIKREKFRNEKGQWNWHTWVYDKPIPPNRGGGSTIPPKTTPGSTTPGKRSNIVSTELKKTDPKITEKENIYLKSKACQMYQEKIGALGTRRIAGIKKWEEKYSEKWIMAAIDRAVKYNKKSFGYVEAILKNWEKNGKNGTKRTPEDVDYLEDEFAEFIED